MKLTAQELDRLISAARERAEDPDLPESEEARYSPFYDYHNIWTACKYRDIEYPFQLSEDVFITETVASYGGEGRGEEFWVVVAVTSPTGTQLFCKDGYYMSYDGGYLDGETYEVEPVEKIVTSYEKKVN